MAKAASNGKSAAKTAYELWQATIDTAIEDRTWHEYDCDIRRIVGVFNRHLSGNGYRALDWRVVKAIIWTETGGPQNPAWKSNPMQIGKLSDPGLRALLSGHEGGELIVPASMRQRMSAGTVKTSATSNIEAGTAYLLMRHARYEVRTILDTKDAKIYTAEVKPGDSLSKIAHNNKTTVEVLKSQNVSTAVLRKGQTLKYQKACLQKVIVGWQLITPSSIAMRYNVGDSAYSKKLSYCLEVMRGIGNGEPACDT